MAHNLDASVSQEVYMVYRRRRGEFGNRLVLQDAPPKLLYTVHQAPHQEGYYLREKASEFDASPTMAVASYATASTPMHSGGMLHLEGGWPAAATTEDSRSAYRSNATSSMRFDRYQFEEQARSAKAVLSQNECIDIYQRYFAADPGANGRHQGPPEGAQGQNGAHIAGDAAVESGPRRLTSFRDPTRDSGREVVQVAWGWTQQDRLAVAFAQPGMRHGAHLPWEAVHLHSYEYTVAEGSVECTASLLPTAQLTCLEYSPRDSLLLAGVSDCTISLFDTRASPRPAQVSSAQSGHCEPVSAVSWLQSRPGVEVCTTAADGLLYVWDIRRLVAPMDSLSLHSRALEEGLLDGASGDTSLEGSALAVCSPSCVAAGTRQGVVLVCGMRGAQQHTGVLSELAEHSGPVRAVLAHPDDPQLLFSLGEWHMASWHMGSGTLCHRTAPHSSLFTAGSWLEGAPVIATADERGQLQLWDLGRSQDAPTQRLDMAACPITSVAAKSRGGGHLLAAGDAGGEVHLASLPLGYLSFADAMAAADQSRTALHDMSLASRVYEATPAFAAPRAQGDSGGDRAAADGSNGSKGQWAPTVDDVATTAQALQAQWRRG